MIGSNRKLTDCARLLAMNRKLLELEAYVYDNMLKQLSFEKLIGNNRKLIGYVE